MFPPAREILAVKEGDKTDWAAQSTGPLQLSNHQIAKAETITNNSTPHSDPGRLGDMLSRPSSYLCRIKVFIGRESMAHGEVGLQI